MTGPADEYVIDLIPDDLALARSQIASGLAPLAEATLRRRIARLELEGPGAMDEIDVARGLLAEALWRQQRPRAAGAALEAIRGSSLERRRPLLMIVEAEAAAASGQPDRAAALMERVLGAVGVDEAWRLRAGMATRLGWPLPASLRPRARRTPSAAAPISSEPEPGRTAEAHARLEGARQAYAASSDDFGDRELGVALRLDPRIAPEGVALIEPTLGEEPSAGRLLLYGDLLRAAGRHADSSAAYDRAARA
ncbi:MAG TPA: hypothetical protein VFX74_05790 [Candidatus Limnocylindria bacterium]|jgi:hypothetical protein|nr:hypothetical protein [Candidatus Limnocylindria bacterium]